MARDALGVHCLGALRGWQRQGTTQPEEARCWEPLVHLRRTGEGWGGLINKVKCDSPRTLPVVYKETIVSCNLKAAKAEYQVQDLIIWQWSSSDD